MRGRSYRQGVKASRVGAPAAIVAQQDSACTVLCSDWANCNTMCGSWPPGLGNAGCWEHCLQPTIDCLQGSTCYPGTPPPPRGCPIGEKCCGVINSAGKCGGDCVPYHQVCGR
jgi:hypothetical protein